MASHEAAHPFTRLHDVDCYMTSHGPVHILCARICQRTTQSQITQFSKIHQHAAQDCTERYKKSCIHVVSCEIINAKPMGRCITFPPCHHTLGVTSALQPQDLIHA